MNETTSDTTGFSSLRKMLVTPHISEFAGQSLIAEIGWHIPTFQVTFVCEGGVFLSGIGMNSLDTFKIITFKFFVRTIKS